MAVMGDDVADGLRLVSHCEDPVTVLFIDIQGFTARCQEVGARRVGEWVAGFYERVDRAATAHGILAVEARGDCCICVAGATQLAPAAASAAAAAAPEEAPDAGTQVVRMLAFARDLDADLVTLCGGADGRGTSTRMGMATGEVVFLTSAPDECAAAPPASPTVHGGRRGSVARCAGGAFRFMSVQGDTVNTAARMESLGAPGVVILHDSAAARWAAETGAPPPPMARVDVKGKAEQDVAEYDCSATTFRLPAAMAMLRRRL
jgi:class 3 adenylate cyclase